MEKDPNFIYWNRRARQIAMRINAGWWLRFFTPLATAGAILSACALLSTRYMQVPSLYVFAGLGVWTVSGGLVALFSGRKKLLSIAGAYSRLDAMEQLDTRLSSAYAGVGKWPEPRALAESRISWNMRTSAPLVAGIIAIAFAGLIPMTESEPEVRINIQPPSALRSVDSALEWLSKEELVREESLQRLVEQVKTLKEQPPESWYSQSSLEGADHIREMTGQTAREMERALERAAAALEMSSALRDQMTESQCSELKQMLQDAINSLNAGALPLNADLLDKIRELDLSQISEISDAQLEEIRDKLLKAGECFGKCATACSVSGIFQTADAGGGIGRGPAGDSQLSFKPSSDSLATAQPLPVSNPDLSRAALGETTGIAEDTHEFDESAYSGPMAAGTITDEGKGGEAVWRMNVLPNDRKILRNYFDL